MRIVERVRVTGRIRGCGMFGRGRCLISRHVGRESIILLRECQLTVHDSDSVGRIEVGLEKMECEREMIANHSG
jgi:hypothetical protein